MNPTDTVVSNVPPLPNSTPLIHPKKNFFSKLTSKQKIGLGFLGATIVALPIAIFALSLQTDLRSRAATSTIPPIITTGSLPAGQVGVNYRATIVGQDVGTSNTLQMKISGLPANFKIASDTSSSEGCFLVNPTTPTPTMTTSPTPTPPNTVCTKVNTQCTISGKPGTCKVRVGSTTKALYCQPTAPTKAITSTPTPVRKKTLGDSTTIAQTEPPPPPGGTGGTVTYSSTCNDPTTIACCLGKTLYSSTTCGIAGDGICNLMSRNNTTGEVKCKFDSKLCNEPSTTACCLGKPHGPIANCGTQGAGQCMPNTQNSSGQTKCTYFPNPSSTCNDQSTVACCLGKAVGSSISCATSAGTNAVAGRCDRESINPSTGAVKCFFQPSASPILGQVITRSCTFTGVFAPEGTYPIDVTLTNTLSGLSSQKKFMVEVTKSNSGNSCLSANTPCSIGGQPGICVNENDRLVCQPAGPISITPTPTTTPTPNATCRGACTGGATSGNFKCQENIWRNKNCPTADSSACVCPIAVPTTSTPTPTINTTSRCDSRMTEFCASRGSLCLPDTNGGHCD